MRIPWKGQCQHGEGGDPGVCPPELGALQLLSWLTCAQFTNAMGRGLEWVILLSMVATEACNVKKKPKVEIFRKLNAAPVTTLSVCIFPPMRLPVTSWQDKLHRKRDSTGSPCNLFRCQNTVRKFFPIFNCLLKRYAIVLQCK